MRLIADSGSTKTDWCLVENGQTIARRQTQGINPFHQDSDTIEAIVRNELLPTFHLPPSTLHVYFYGSGCREELVPGLRAVLSRCFPHATTIEVKGDMLGAARAVCGRSEGIACILGTGANSCLYDGSRMVRNTPPLGYILGDEGSGAVLGRSFINALYKGRLPETLRDEFEQHTGLTMADIIAKVYREPMANRFLASLSPFIGRHLDMPQVHGLVVESFRDFFRYNVAPYGRADLPVGFVGSIAAHYQAQLDEAARKEGFQMGKVMQSPMAGLIAYHENG